MASGFGADRMARIAFLVSLMFFVGCGTGPKPETRMLIPLTRVPAPVRSAAYFKVQGVRYHSAWVTNDGQYQLSGRDADGKVTNIDFAADGTILRIR